MQVIDLGSQYLQGSFQKAGVQEPPFRKLPTALVRCDASQSENACGLLQLSHSVSPDILYANYWYTSGTNQTMRDHLRGIVDSVVELNGRSIKRVLDIGCNDGTLLRNYADKVEKWGVDPSNIARAIEPFATLVNSVFPSQSAARAIGSKKFDVVTSIAMYYDLEAPVDFAREIASILAPAGIWVLEMSYMPFMLLRNSFDTICHEHLEYYSFGVLDFIAKSAGLRLFKVAFNEINGGSIRCYLCRENFTDYDNEDDRLFIERVKIKEFDFELDTEKPYRDFQARIEVLKKEMQALLKKIALNGQKVHVYGASTKGNVLLQWYEIDQFKIQYAADRNPMKHGARTLGTDIKIISEEESRAMKPDYYLVLPWHFKSEFLERERDTIMRGTKMIFPLPELLIVDKENVDQQIKSSKDATGDLMRVFSPSSQ